MQLFELPVKWGRPRALQSGLAGPSAVAVTGPGPSCGGRRRMGNPRLATGERDKIASSQQPSAARIAALRAVDGACSMRGVAGAFCERPGLPEKAPAARAKPANPPKPPPITARDSGLSHHPTTEEEEARHDGRSGAQAKAASPYVLQPEPGGRGGTAGDGSSGAFSISPAGGEGLHGIRATLPQGGAQGTSAGVAWREERPERNAGGWGRLGGAWGALERGGFSNELCVFWRRRFLEEVVFQRLADLKNSRFTDPYSLFPYGLEILLRKYAFGLTKISKLLAERHMV